MKHPDWANYLIDFRGEQFYMSSLTLPYLYQEIKNDKLVIPIKQGTAGGLGRNGKVLIYLGDEENE